MYLWNLYTEIDTKLSSQSVYLNIRRNLYVTDDHSLFKHCKCQMLNVSTFVSIAAWMLTA
jgi:hypothetical protein